MKESEYSKKLRDPRWQKKRLEILERDGWQCKGCGDTNKTLHVHHIFYLKNREPWEVPNGFLVTLCEQCHASNGCENHVCEKCEDYVARGGDCDGAGDIGETLIETIAVILDEIWKNGKGKEYTDILYPIFTSLRQVEK